MKNQDEFEVLRRALGGRLSQDVLDDALSYVGFGECTLAVETLCDQLYEYNVPITNAEHESILALAERYNAKGQRVSVLASLVINEASQHKPGI